MTFPYKYNYRQSQFGNLKDNFHNRLDKQFRSLLIIDIGELIKIKWLNNMQIDKERGSDIK